MDSKYLLNINENNILNLVAGDNYIIVNRTLIKNLGLKEAVILGELASEFNYYKKNNLLDENGYFYSTIENIEENTGLSRSQQKTVLDKLKELEIIDVIVKGIPAKRYVKINAFRLISQYAEKLQTSLLKTDKLECQKLTTKNNNKSNKENNITIDMIYEYLEENGFVLAPIHYEVINEWDPNELTMYAIKKAVLNNKFNINYIDKILYSYKKDNITTVQQAIEKEEEFNNKRELYYKKKYEVKESRYEREKRILAEMCRDEEE